MTASLTMNFFIVVWEGGSCSFPQISLCDSIEAADAELDSWVDGEGAEDEDIEEHPGPAGSYVVRTVIVGGARGRIERHTVVAK